MEQPKIGKQEVIPPQTVEEAVKMFTRQHDEAAAIAYLRTHRQDITEFCLQTVESYQSGDKTGIIQLGMIIEKLL
jgi:hypothetical protein